MAEPKSDLIATRGRQMFPTLSPEEIERLGRFGAPRAYASGEPVFRIGEVGPGLVLVVSGQVDITQADEFGRHAPIVTHGPGSFIGELAELSGRPSLVNADARSAVEGMVIPPERLRALLVAEAELGETIMRALILRRVGLIESAITGPVVIGPPGHADVLRLEEFLRRSGHPHRWLDPDTDPDARALLERFHVRAADLPIVLCPGGQMLRNPGEADLAACLGLLGPLDTARLWDVAIVGAGPAGLASAVYAGSEGLSVLTLDCRSFGGQAGASARIENYLGFPTGVSGIALMARAYNQAQKFGVEMAIPKEAAGLAPTADGFQLTTRGGETIQARAVVIASGARYRRLDARNLAAYEGSYVHYWASPMEVQLCAGQEVGLVGAGNSAGQAVVYLASQARKVWLFVRGPGLEASMSRYLIDRIKDLPNVELVTQAEVDALEGEDGSLQAVTWRDVRTGQTRRQSLSHLFLFIGAVPNTDWLAQSGVALDPRGFVLAGAELSETHRPLETSLPGAFAVGDVRSSSVKRVAASVGEGAQVVAALHAFLGSRTPAAAPPPTEGAPYA
jgi:thioredoxin reductase (NADPH)